MKTRELMKYSRKLVKGHRSEILLICILPIGTEFFLRTAEASLYCLMLYFGNIKPINLFNGNVMEQVIISALFVVLRCVVMPPLWCGLASRLMMFAEGKKESATFTDMLLSGKFISRAIGASLFGRLISAMFLLPCIVTAGLGISMLTDGAKGSELIISTSLITAGIGFGILWAAVKLGLTAVPFLLWAHSEYSPFKTVMLSFRFMRNRRKLPLALMLVYLPLVPFIYFIPEWAVSYAVGVSIFLKEDEESYGQTCIFRADGDLQKSGELSSLRMWDISRTAEKAQK